MRPFWLTLGLRELRGGLAGGLAGFRALLACLALGVAGIATVGSVVAAIGHGLAAEGRTLLGGDVSIVFTYRFASEEERAWMASQGAVSEVVDLRSMLGSAGGDERALAQVKGVDAAYPLVGELRLSPEIGIDEALAPRDGVPGLVARRALVERLGLAIGDRVELAGSTFELRAVIEHEPDSLAAGPVLGPRVIVRTEALRDAGLLGPGTLFETLYRLRLEAPGELAAELAALQREFSERFPESGARWRDTRDAAPGIGRFVGRIGAFLTLTALSALAIGGVGVGAAVRGYLDRKTRTIAALRALGAGGHEIFLAYAFQIGVIAGIGILLGLALGAAAAALIAPMLAERLPVPAAFGVYPGPLGVAALYGALTAALFTLWPLGRLRGMRPALLFRDLGEGRAWPGGRLLAAVVAVAFALVVAVAGLSGERELALWVMAAVAGGFLALRGLGILARRGARRLSRARALRHRPGLRLALGAVGAPGGPTADVVVALGMALAVLAAIGQIDANLQRLIRDQLPAGSPAFFFVDIQNDQLARFRDLVGGTAGVERIETAPMLRGVITRLDGVPAAEAEIDPDAAWVLSGDRGVTYAATPPANAEITEGAWWPEDHDGEPLVSFADEEGRELGLGVGETVTVSVLGRPITARVANLREVEWQGLGINFLMIMNPSALEGAPHTHIATVYAAPDAEVPVMRATAREMPNVTAVSVREQVDRVAGALAGLGRAARWASAALLLTGLLVLVGAAAAAAERQTGEAAVLKVLGAERRRILASFALRAALLGALAGLAALAAGTAGAWAATRFALGADFVAEPATGLAVVAAGVALSLGAGLVFALGPLRARPARVLRRAAG